MAFQVLKPLREMALQAETITASHLDQRLPVDNPNDELGHMARVLNDLLGRLEDSFNNLKRFTADASHELRTPLSSIRSVGEVGLQRQQTPEEYRDTIGSMLEEVNRLTQMWMACFPFHAPMPARSRCTKPLSARWSLPVR